MYYIFFIPSSVSGHRLLPCPGYINSAAPNTESVKFFNYGFVQLYAQEWDFWIIW